MMLLWVGTKKRIITLENLLRNITGIALTSSDFYQFHFDGG